MSKFPEAREMLVSSAIIGAADITEVHAVSRAHLERVHTTDYLDRLARGDLTHKETIKLGLPPSPELFQRCSLEVEGTRLAVWAALQDGIAQTWRAAPTMHLPITARASVLSTTSR